MIALLVACTGGEIGGIPTPLDTSEDSSWDSGDSGTLLNQRRLTVGGNHSCLLEVDGTPACWGDDSSGQSTTPEGLFVRIDAGDSSTCALDVDGAILCWGAELSGAPTGDGYVNLSVGAAHACALHEDEHVDCWGANSNGESSAPTGALDGVRAGDGVSCGQAPSGTLTCWGGVGESADAPSGAYGSYDITSSTGCGVKTSDDSIACWGRDNNDQKKAPSGVFSKVAMGVNNGCAADSDGATTCWGLDADGITTAPAAPLRAIGVGAHHACGVRQDESVLCWGTDTMGSGALTPPS